MTFAHLDDVLAEVGPLGLLFNDAGYRLYLVGGIVRDQWLDAPLESSSDIDMTTDALPADIKRLVASIAEDLWTQGERFGTIGLRAGGRDYEITTHRAESYTSDSRKPVVCFGDDIIFDLSRRDFTVNAMAIELPGGDLVDPYGGASDLEAGLLRTPLGAELSFSDDPLRMLRAARFSTKYSLAPVDEIVSSAHALHQRLRIVAIERIGIELRRLLELDNAATGVKFLTDAGLMAEVLAYGQPALQETSLPRLATADQVVEQLPADWRMRLAGIGLTVFDDADGVRSLCDRLRLSRDHSRHVTRLARAAQQILGAADFEPATIRRWLASSEDHNDAIELARVLDPVAPVDAFERAVALLQSTEDTTAVSLLGGADVMHLLGVTPGPVVGRAQEFLRDRYFALGPLSDRTQADLLIEWWASQPDQGQAARSVPERESGG